MRCFVLSFVVMWLVSRSSVGGFIAFATCTLD
jgi:hypothetical protein